MIIETTPGLCPHGIAHKCKNYGFSKFGAVILIMLLFFSVCVAAQPEKKQVRIYHVVIKTSKGTHRGILERCTSSKVYVSAKNGAYIAINALDIRTIKIKEYPKKRRVVEVPVLEPGLTDYTSDGFLSKQYLERAPSLGEEVTYSALGLGITAVYGFFYNQFHNERVFRPRYNIESYKKQITDLSLYAVYNQNASEYDIILFKSDRP